LSSKDGLDRRAGIGLCARSLKLGNRFDDANNAEGEHLAGDKEDGEINPHLQFSAQIG